MDVVTLKLEATVADLDALAGLAQGRGRTTRVDRDLLARIVVGRGRLYPETSHDTDHCN